MTDNLFANNDQQFDESKNWYEEYTKEGGKFYDPDPEKAKMKLGLGKAHSDHYIRTLESERDVIRDELLKVQSEYNASLKLQELIDKQLGNQPQLSRDITPNSNDQDTHAPAFDPQKLEEMLNSKLESKLQEAERRRSEEANLQTVMGKVVERYGDNFRDKLKAQAESLGLTEEEANEMAKKQPKLFIRTFDLEKQSQQNLFQAPPTTSQRQDTSTNRFSNVRKRSYYEELRKKDLNTYLDPKTMVQMDRDVQAIGWDAFNDIPN